MLGILGKYFDLNAIDQTSGANDVIVVRHMQNDPSRDESTFPLKSTPFHVRFGWFKVFRGYDKVIQVEVNGIRTSAYMKIGEGGIAYWLHPTNTPRRPRRRRATAAVNDKRMTETVVKGTAVLTQDGGTLYAGTVVVTTGEGGEQPATDANSVAQQPSVSTKQSKVKFSESTEHGSHAGTAGGTVAGEHGDHNDVDALVEAAELSRRRISRINMTDTFLIGAARSEGEVINTREKEKESTAQLSSRGGDENEEQSAAADHCPQECQQVYKGTVVPPPPDAGETSTSGASAAGGVADEPAERLDPSECASPTAEDKLAELRAEDTAALEALRRGSIPHSEDADLAGTGGEATPVDQHVDPAAQAADPQDDAAEEDDEYYLEPMDAQDYLEEFGEEAFLKNCSFASSYTSGFGSELAGGDAVNGGESSGNAKPAVAAPAAATAGHRRTHAEEYEFSDGDDVFEDGELDFDYDEDELDENGQPHHHPNHTHSGPTYFTRSVYPTEEDLRKLGLRNGLNQVRFILPGTNVPAVAKEASSKAAANTAVAARAVATGASPQKTGDSAVNEGSNSGEGATTASGLHAGQQQQQQQQQPQTGSGTTADGEVFVSCNIFLWNSTDKIVVSDVDGTITRSDLMGHFYYLMGRGNEWNHDGICSLYSRIHRNGYQFIYVTARSVSQMMQTKHFLFNQTKQDSFVLPIGPVFTAPQRFFSALTQEVGKRSHIFKIACLNSIREAFPPQYNNSAGATKKKTEEELRALEASTIHNSKSKGAAGNRQHHRHTLKYCRTPFFAGFGNRFNDVISYDAVDIPVNRIFIIDPQSNLHVCQTRRSFANLSELVDFTFPPRPMTVEHTAVSGTALSAALTDTAYPHAQAARMTGSTSAGGAAGPGAGNSSSSVSSYSLDDDDDRNSVDSEVESSAAGGLPQRGHDKPKPTYNTAFLLNTSNLDMAVGCAPDGKNPLFTHSRSTAPSAAATEKNNSSYNAASRGGDGEDVDSHFSSFNYWQIDPRDLTTPVPGTGVVKGTPVSAGTGDVLTGTVQARNASKVTGGKANQTGTAALKPQPPAQGSPGARQGPSSKDGSGGGFFSFLYGANNNNNNNNNKGSSKGGGAAAPEPSLGSRQRALMHPDAVEYYREMEFAAEEGALPSLAPTLAKGKVVGASEAASGGHPVLQGKQVVPGAQVSAQTTTLPDVKPPTESNTPQQH